MFLMRGSHNEMSKRLSFVAYLTRDYPSLYSSFPPSFPSFLTTQVMMRAIAFFYHLSLSILVATWTELLLEGFGNSYSKAVAYLG